MFEYLGNWWIQNEKPDAVGEILRQLQLWDSDEGKRPMDAAIFSEWLKSITKLVTDCNSKNEYNNTDTKLIK